MNKFYEIFVEIFSAVSQQENAIQFCVSS